MSDKTPATKSETDEVRVKVGDPKTGIAPDMSKPANSRTATEASHPGEAASSGLPSLKVQADTVEAALKQSSWYTLGLGSKPDGQRVVDVLGTMKPEERKRFEKEFPADERVDLRSDLKKYLGEKSPEYIKAVSLLDERPGETDYAGNFSTAVETAKQNPDKGTRQLRGILSTMTEEQILGMNVDVKGAVDGIPELSAPDRTILETLAKGSDKLTPDNIKDMANLVVTKQLQQVADTDGMAKSLATDPDGEALGIPLLDRQAQYRTGVNLQTFSDVLNSDTPAAKSAREQLQHDPGFMTRFGQAFDNQYSSKAQQSQAVDLLKRGEITAASVAAGDTLFGLFDSKNSIQSSVQNASDKERADFSLGRKLSAAGDVARNQEEQTALDYYKKTDQALKSAGDERQVRIWEDELQHGTRTQGFVNEVVGNPRSTIGDVADALAHLSTDEAKALHDPNSELRKSTDAAIKERQAGSGPGYDAAALVLASSIQKRVEQTGEPGSRTPLEQLALDALKHPSDELKKIALAEAIVQDPTTRERLNNAQNLQSGRFDAPNPGVSKEDFQNLRLLNSLVPSDAPLPNMVSSAMSGLLEHGRVPFMTRYRAMNHGLGQDMPIRDLTGHYEDVAALPPNERDRMIANLHVPTEQSQILQRTIAGGGKMDEVDRIRSYANGDGSSYKDLPDLTKLTPVQVAQYQDRFKGNLQDDLLAQVRKDAPGAVPLVSSELNTSITQQQRQYDQLAAGHGPGNTPASINEQSSLAEGQKALQQYDALKAQMPLEAQQKLDSLARRFAEAHTEVNADTAREQAIVKEAVLTAASFGIGGAFSGLFRAAALAPRVAATTEAAALVANSTATAVREAGVGVKATAEAGSLVSNQAATVVAEAKVGVKASTEAAAVVRPAESAAKAVPEATSKAAPEATATVAPEAPVKAAPETAAKGAPEAGLEATALTPNPTPATVVARANLGFKGNIEFMSDGHATLTQKDGTQIAYGYTPLGNGQMTIFELNKSPMEISKNIQTVYVRETGISNHMRLSNADWRRFTPEELQAVRNAIPEGSAPTGAGASRQAWHTPDDHIVVVGPPQERPDSRFLRQPIKSEQVGGLQIDEYEFADHKNITKADVDAFNQKMRDNGWTPGFDTHPANYVRDRQGQLWRVDPQGVERIPPEQ